MEAKGSQDDIREKGADRGKHTAVAGGNQHMVERHGHEGCRETRKTTEMCCPCTTKLDMKAGRVLHCRNSDCYQERNRGAAKSG